MEWDLRPVPTLRVGILSAAGAGDNVAYWLGRRYGRWAFDHYAHLVRVTPERLETMWRLVRRYGVFGGVVARLVPGLRFLGGPLAGAAGLKAMPFALANLLGVSLATREGGILDRGRDERSWGLRGSLT